MKKIIKFIAIVFLSFGLFAQNVFATANTLGDLKKELANLKAEKSAYEASKNKTQSISESLSCNMPQMQSLL